MNAKTAAFSKLAFNRDVTAMRLGNVFDDCQPQTGSTHIATAGFVHPLETFEEPRQVLLRNTDALVLNADNHLGILLV
jgi:hypothetical protein